MDGTLYERFNHKLFGKHYSKSGIKITRYYWRFQPDALVGVPCVVCKQTIRRPTGDDPITTLAVIVTHALKIPEFTEWLNRKLVK